MRGLLVFREGLRAFYAKNSAFVTAACRFAVAFAAVFLIGQNAGYMPQVSGPFVPVLAGVIGAVIPYGVTAFLVGCLLLAQLYAASLEVAIVTFLFLLMIVLLYYGFQPGDSVLLLVTPVLCFLKMPFAVPLLIGLAGSLISVIPMSCGIFVYYVIQFVRQSSGFLAGSEQTEITQVFAQVLKSLLANPAMLVMIAACCLGALAVYVIKNLSVNYSWSIAIAAGVIVQMAAALVGDFRFGVSVSVPELIAALLLSALAAAVYQFFVFTVDYSRTEYVQFEDDDYCYYVKAVPKVAITKTDVRVKKINKVNKSKKTGREP